MKETQFSSIETIDRTLSGTTTPVLTEPGSNGHEGVVHIPQSTSVIRTPPSDCLVSLPGHSAEVQSVYFSTPADWAIHRVKCQTFLFQIIQFSISTQCRRQKQFYFEQFNSALVRSSTQKIELR